MRFIRHILSEFVTDAIAENIAALIRLLFTKHRKIFAASVLIIAACALSMAAYREWVRIDERNKKNLPEVREIFLRAENGDSAAQNKLGIMYHNGEIFRVNYDEAFYWFKRSAENNNVYGMYNLAGMYYDGEGTEQDYGEALRLYIKAGSLELAAAQNAAGLMYQHGLGCTADYKEAVSWYEKAAAQKHSGALNNLAIMYYNGWGVPEDCYRALELYDTASALGNITAQYNAGFLLEHGDHEPIIQKFKPDFQRAYMYYWLAHLGGSKDAKSAASRAAKKGKLSVSQIEAARAEAAGKFRAIRKAK